MGINNKISKAGILLAVSNFETSKAFYETILEQKVEEEAEGFMVYFESGIALQAGYAELVAGEEVFAPRPTGAKLTMTSKPNNCQVGFEVEDLEYWVAKIKAAVGIELLHDVAEYNWGQRVIRFYDYDGHIIELGECLKVVAKRFLAQGLTVEDVAERFGDSVAYVQQLLHSQ